MSDKAGNLWFVETTQRSIKASLNKLFKLLGPKFEKILLPCFESCEDYPLEAEFNDALATPGPNSVFVKSSLRAVGYLTQARRLCERALAKTEGGNLEPFEVSPLIALALDSIAIAEFERGNISGLMHGGFKLSAKDISDIEADLRSKLATIAANVRHKENKQLKADALAAWEAIRERLNNNKEAGADAIAGKIVPVSRTTVRRWLINT